MGQYTLTPKRPGILLVEDSPTEARLSLNILALHSSAPEIHWAKNGPEALSMLSDFKSDAIRLVLMDIKMPLLSGIDTLAKIREKSSLNHMPVVMFTSSNLPSDIRASYASGANGYLQKQVDYDEQVVALQKTLDFWVECNETG